MVLPYLLINGGSPGSFDLTLTQIYFAPAPAPSSIYDGLTTFAQYENALDVWQAANRDTIEISILGAPDATSFKYRYAEMTQTLSALPYQTSSSRTFNVTVPNAAGKNFQLEVRAVRETSEGDALWRVGIYIPKNEINTSKFQSPEYLDAFARPGIETFSYGIINDIPYADAFSRPGIETFTTGIKQTEYQDAFLRPGAPTMPKSPSILQNKKSLLSITNSSKDTNEYGIAYKTFQELPIVDDYYTFGTTMFLNDDVVKPAESGGFGFFVNNYGKTGYFVQVDSTKRSGDISSKRRIRVFKVVKGDKIRLQDSQTGPESTIDAIHPGKIYKLDVKLKYETNKVTIDLYVNGFKITATDTSNVLPRTKTVAIFSNIGTVNFDYIYGMAIQDWQYKLEYIYNIYSGQYGKNILDFNFGEKIFNKNEKQGGTFQGWGRTEDFGKIAREIRKIEFKFKDPAFPIAPSAGINNFVEILGYKQDNFGSECYVLNNSGTYNLLSGENNQFAVYGYSISKSSDLEYSNNSSNTYTEDESVYFDTNWLQNEKDVVKLAEWLKTEWAKRSYIIDMQVFGAVLISVGDIVTINYPHLEITNTQKFVVQNVSHSFEGGVSTSIRCRTI